MGWQTVLGSTKEQKALDGRRKRTELMNEERQRRGGVVWGRQKAAGKGVETESYIVEIKASSPKS